MMTRRWLASGLGHLPWTPAAADTRVQLELHRHTDPYRCCGTQRNHINPLLAIVRSSRCKQTAVVSSKVLTPYVQIQSYPSTLEFTGAAKDSKFFQSMYEQRVCGCTLQIPLLVLKLQRSERYR